MDFTSLILGFVLGVLPLGFLWVTQKKKSVEETANLTNSYESRLEELSKTEKEKTEEIFTLKSSLSVAEEKISNLNTRLAEESQRREKELQEKKEELNNIQKQLKTEFENIANRVLESNSQKFTDQNKLNMSGILSPLADKIKSFEEKVTKAHESRLQGQASLEKQLSDLQSLNQKITQEAHSLTVALKGDSKTQGNWGEMQLETLLNYAGLEKDIHYKREDAHKNESGDIQRLDFLVMMPDNKNLVIDSKVSLTAYMNYTEAMEGEKEPHLKAHLLSIRNHIKGLGERDYQKLFHIPQPDYVMLFVANEPALTLALREDKALYEYALKHNIVLVSSTTLLAVLKTVSYIWNQDKQSKNAIEIATQAGNLYDKFVLMTQDFEKMGKQLNTVQKTYEDNMKHFEGRGNLLTRVEKLKKMGAKASKQLTFKSELPENFKNPPQGEEN